MLKRTDEQKDELADESFMEDSDVWEALLSWKQGHYSNKELIDKLAYASQMADARINELENQGFLADYEKGD